MLTRVKRKIWRTTCLWQATTPQLPFEIGNLHVKQKTRRQEMRYWHNGWPGKWNLIPTERACAIGGQSIVNAKTSAPLAPELSEAVTLNVN